MIFVFRLRSENHGLLHDKSRIDAVLSTSESGIEPTASDSVANAATGGEAAATIGTDVNAVMNANVVQQAANRTSTNRRELKAASARAVAVTKAAAVANAKAVTKTKAAALAKAKDVSVAKANACPPAKSKAKEAGDTVAAAGRGGPMLTEANYTASVVREGLRSSHSLPTSYRKRSNEESMSAQDPNTQESRNAELMKQLDETKSEMKVRTTSIMLVVLYFV